SRTQADKRRGTDEGTTMDRRNFLASVEAAALAAGTASAVQSGESDRPKSYRVIDVHLHLFNTKLQGTRGIPKYIASDATVDTAFIAMQRGGVDKAFLISYAAEDVAVQIRQRGIKPDLLRAVVSKEYQVAAWKAHRDRFWWFTDHLDPMRPMYLEDLERD